MTKKEFAEIIIRESMEKTIDNINTNCIRLYYKEIRGLSMSFTSRQFDFIKPFCTYDGTSYKNGERKYKLNFKIDGFNIKFSYCPSTKYCWDAYAEHETYSDEKFLYFSDKMEDDLEFRELVLSKKLKTLDGIFKIK